MEDKIKLIESMKIEIDEDMEFQNEEPESCGTCSDAYQAGETYGRAKAIEEILKILKG